jgi:pseudouridine 5'-phosphatase
MDGLLLNTEDIYTLCANNVLLAHGRPPLPWSLKARLMGVPGSSTGDTFHAWAQLPIPREQFALEQREQQRLHFPECSPLPGAMKLLSDLKHAKGVELALASSSNKSNYELKVVREETKKLLGMFEEERQILGDDNRVKRGRGKPAPDIYLVALRTINASLEGSAEEIRPEECLVFEDSVLGVEAGRRAGMRVVWVPHPGLAGEYRGREKEVLAGRTGLVPIEDEEQLGEVDDGWGLHLPSLEDFPYERFGIVID